MKQELSRFDRGIGPAKTMCYVLSLPTTAPALIADSKEKDASLVDVILSDVELYFTLEEA